MKIKRITAVITAVMTINTMLPTVFVKAAAEPVLQYDFSDGATDISGHSMGGTIYGALIENKKAVFDGKDDYIKLPDGILSGAQSASVSIYLKPDIEKMNQFTWCIGNTSTTGYMFLNTSNPSGKVSAEIPIYADLSLEPLAEELAPDREIRGNQYMPQEHNGVKITWTCDNAAVAPDGTVTRGNEDIPVNITAVYDNGAYQYTKTNNLYKLL